MKPFGMGAKTVHCLHLFWYRTCQSTQPGTLLSNRRIYTFTILILFRLHYFECPFLYFSYIKHIREWKNVIFWSIPRCHVKIRDVNEFHVAAGQSLTQWIREGQSGTTDVGYWKPPDSNTPMIYPPPTNFPWLSNTTQNTPCYIYATVVWNKNQPNTTTLFQNDTDKKNENHKSILDEHAWGPLNEMTGTDHTQCAGDMDQGRPKRLESQLPRFL